MILEKLEYELHTHTIWNAEQYSEKHILHLE